MKPLVQSLAPYKRFMVTHACKPSTKDEEAGGIRNTEPSSFIPAYMRLSHQKRKRRNSVSICNPQAVRDLRYLKEEGRDGDCLGQPWTD